MSSAKSFATLLKNSKFITQGDFRNATVIGKVFHVVGDDLYVDVGMKFHAVVKRPQQDGRLYTRNSRVKLRLISYEITDKFIGSSNYTTLLEADAVLLGLESTWVGSKHSEKSKAQI